MLFDVQVARTLECQHLNLVKR